ncbi:alkaline phosphatase-like family protein [Lactobacillus helveticus DSM 20075 = CGMCC 1.1877]|nr:alkaline phosphatase-like family protein [Lactobacillus helveticus DSM 20075 = CGMCC 1.1877]
MMTNFVFDLINQFSYMAISFLIAIENVFPSIPSEVILSFAGFATHHSQMTVVGTVIASTYWGSPWSFNFIRYRLVLK